MSIYASVTLLDFGLNPEEASMVPRSSVISAAPILACFINLTGSIESNGCLIVLPTLAALVVVLLWKASKVFNTNMAGPNNLPPSSISRAC